MTLITLFLSPLFLVIFIYILKYNLNNYKFYKIYKAVYLAFFGVSVLLLADYLFKSNWHNQINNMRRMVVYVFVGIAFSSEFTKFAILRYGYVKQRLIKGPFGGIIVAIITNLSFTTVSNILFYFNIIGTDRVHYPNLLLWSYPFASIILGIILGFFIGQGETRKNAFIDSMVGLFLATFFHAALYFCFITSDLRLFIVISLGFLVIGFGLLFRAINLKE